MLQRAIGISRLSGSARATAGVRTSTDRAQAARRVLGRQVALRLGQQLVADHELAHVGAQERRIEVRVDLPVVGRPVTERRLVPAHRVRERPLEQPVVAASQLVQDDRQVVARRVVEVGQARGGSLGHEQRLERPGRPERHDDEPLVALDDDPLAARLAARRNRAAAACRSPPGGRAAWRPRARHHRAAPCRPRSGRADAGSRHPSPRRGSRRPGPSGNRRRARRSARPTRR